MRQRIFDSGLFDSDYYVLTYPLARGIRASPLNHYLQVGSSKGYHPHPLFHAGFYKRKYLATADSQTNPLFHYLTEGAVKGHQPHPLFDPHHYEGLSDISGYATPLQHYLESKSGRFFSPHSLFDPQYSASGGASSKKIPLVDYIESWSTVRKSPHPLFDLSYYLSRYQEVLNSEYDPVSHYLEVGTALGYNPHPLFDTEYYYRTNPDVKQAGTNALLHYLTHGGFEGRDPLPWFHSSYYLEANPDVAAARINPLLHYVQFGEAENRSPHPLSRVRDGKRVNPDSALASSAPVRPLFQPETRTQSLQSIDFRNRLHCRSQNSGEVGVNIIGFPRAEIGIGECCREVARAFLNATSDCGIRDVSSMSPSDLGDESVSEHIIPECRFHTNLFVLNADNMLGAVQKLGKQAVHDRFNAVMWAWELAEFPDAWVSEMQGVDEFWAISSFNQQCLAMKAKVPVLLMPQPVTVSDAERSSSRADFGLPEFRFAFFFQFDFTGYVDRKNPYACLAAFRSAFSNRSPSDPVLVIKTNNSERYLEEMRKLKDAVGIDPNVFIVDGTLRREKVLALMKTCDAFVSLHRAEGFGRSLAEAMLLGKPVIGTNYSGNTDFMRPDNSCLVNYELVPVQDGQYPHGTGQVWAEADIDHAAWHMRRLFTNRSLRNQISRAGAETIAENYSGQVLGARYLRRLRLLGLMK